VIINYILGTILILMEKFVFKEEGEWVEILKLIINFLVIIYFSLALLDFFVLKFPYFSIEKNQFYLGLLIICFLISVILPIHEKYELLVESEFFLLLIVCIPISIKLGDVIFKSKIQKILIET
jgi:hypothetical protein